MASCACANLGPQSESNGRISPSARIRLHSGMTISGAPLQKSVGPSGVACTVDSRMRPTSNGISSSFLQSGSAERKRCAVSTSAISIGSPSSTVRPSLFASLKIVAQARGHKERPVLRRDFSTASGSSEHSKSAPSQRRLTVIRFWVSVPVLSVQITVVEPSVSTDGR